MIYAKLNVTRIIIKINDICVTQKIKVNMKS